jgi:methylenetetrahydrofolate--tRNA-(uracil-5-)-methyltransferase
LLGHITEGADADSFQPMNVNFGLMPPLTGPRSKKADRKKLYTERARTALGDWLAGSRVAKAA